MITEEHVDNGIGSQQKGSDTHVTVEDIVIGEGINLYDTLNGTKTIQRTRKTRYCNRNR